MDAQRQPSLTLIGGGLAGGLLATYLGRAGFDVNLYERRPDPSAGNFVGGRSINLAVSTRGIDALDRVGLADAALAHAIRMPGRMIHDRSGGLHFQPYDKDPAKCIYSIGRSVLNSVTLEAAQKFPNVRVHFDQRCTDVDLDAPAAKLAHTVSGAETSVASDLVIGVDGAFSAVRRSMQRLDRFDYRQDYLRHGYKELSIPPAVGGGFLMERNALHIWPRKSFMMIALPNPDGSFTCTLFLHFEGSPSFATLRNESTVREFFDDQFPDALAMMPTLVEDFAKNPTGSMVTIRCAPWHHRDKVVLLGDAAHAVVPFYGQGMNAAFEDVVVLDDCIKRLAPNWESALAEYENLRRPHTDALANLAIENFIEMRDKTASRTFRMRKKLERTLHKNLPGLYTPLYTMVSFSRTPYREAVQRAKRQDRIVLVTAVFVAIGLLTVTFRLILGDRWVACLGMAATIVYIIVQWIVARHGVGRSSREPEG